MWGLGFDPTHRSIRATAPADADRSSKPLPSPLAEQTTINIVKHLCTKAPPTVEPQASVGFLELR